MKGSRKAVCRDCGYEWFPRSSTGPKPAKCSACSSRNVAWVDTLETNMNNQTQYQPQPFAQPVEAAPEPQVFYEPRQSAPPRNPTPADIKAAVREAVKECVREEVNAASAPTYQAPPQYYPPQYYPPAMNDADKEELQAFRDDLDQRLRNCERVRDFAQDDEVEVIENPDYVGDDEDFKVGYINYSGRPCLKVAVSEDDYEKLLRLKEKERAEECGKSAIKDIAKLSRSGKIAVREAETNALTPQEKRGISAGAIAAVLAVGGIAVVGYILFEKYLAAKRAQADAEDPNYNSLQKKILYSNKVLRDQFAKSSGLLEV